VGRKANPRKVGADAKFQFLARKGYQSEAIVFIQVVRTSQILTNNGLQPLYPAKGQESYYRHFSTDTEKANMVDHVFKEEDMYYNAVLKSPWFPFLSEQRKTLGWSDDPGFGTVGYGDVGSATMHDFAGTTNPPRSGATFFKEFEVAAFSVDNQEVLGVLRWGYSYDAFRDQVGLYQPVFSNEPSEEFRQLVLKANAQPAMKYKVYQPRPKGQSGISALPAYKPGLPGFYSDPGYLTPEELKHARGRQLETTPF
jgi:hypothetical protein